MDKYELQKIPSDVHISTITAKYTMNNISFNCENIARYIELSNDCIVSVFCAGANEKIDRSLSDIINRKSDKKLFKNCTTLYTIINNKKTTIKIFSSGMILVTGCKQITEISDTINNVLDQIKNDNNVDKYVSDKKMLDLFDANNFEIQMINCNYKTSFEINLESLHDILSKSEIKSRCDPTIHSCVSISYSCKHARISIFVFRGGSVVITGAKNGSDINSAYTFIKTILDNNYDQIATKKICGVVNGEDELED
jgi:TATA-box binding protein (TBP) (component of TFIID and TFIIIB)